MDRDRTAPQDIRTHDHHEEIQRKTMKKSTFNWKITDKNETAIERTNEKHLKTFYFLYICVNEAKQFMYTKMRVYVYLS